MRQIRTPLALSSKNSLSRKQSYRWVFLLAGSVDAQIHERMYDDRQSEREEIARALICLAIVTQQAQPFAMGHLDWKEVSDRSIDKREQYVGFATHCLQLAKVTDDHESRAILRAMAAEWLRLAEVRQLTPPSPHWRLSCCRFGR
jgi:hypothetical protein